MTNKELSAALRDLDAQIDEFVREHVVAEGVSSSLRITEVPEGGDECQSHVARKLAKLAAEQGQQLNVRGGAAAKTIAQQQNAEHNTNNTKSINVNFPAPEPHEPTKVLGWLLVGFAGFCVYVLGATIFKFWPVIVRTLR